MSLSTAAPRRHLHNRDISLRGYLRDDGLIDIEAHLTDAKTHDEPRSSGPVRLAGEPVHDMWLRMTITSAREIVACEASMDATPYGICPGVAPNFALLAGLTIEGGFLKKAMEKVGGSSGCTHLRELLQQVGTVAVQTLYSVGKMNDDPQSLGGRRPPLLDSCFAWSAEGALVAERYPAWARVPAAE